MTNEVRISREARKDLKRLRSHEDQALLALTELETNAYAGHALTGTLEGLRSLKFHLPGSGAYRAIYLIQATTVVLVILVGPRENIYREAERRYKPLR